MKKKYAGYIVEGRGQYEEDGIKEDCHHCKHTGQVNYTQNVWLTEDLNFEIERMENYRSPKKWMVEVTYLRSNEQALIDGHSPIISSDHNKYAKDNKIPYHEYKCDSWGRSYKQAYKRSLKKCKKAGLL